MTLAAEAPVGAPGRDGVERSVPARAVGDEIGGGNTLGPGAELEADVAGEGPRGAGAGSTATATILDDCRRRLSLPPIKIG
jgi:hypothetical protein